MEKLQEAKECTRMYIADDFHAIDNKKKVRAGESKK